MEQNPNTQGNAPAPSDNIRESLGNGAPRATEKPEEKAVKEGVDSSLHERASGDADKEGGLVRKVRTYKEDIVEAIQRQKTSLTSAVAAEERRRTSVSRFIESAESKKPDYRKISAAVGSVLFILLGVGLLGFFLFFYEPPKASVEEDIPSLIFTEEHREIDITGKDARDILRTLGESRRAVLLGLGQITHLYLTQMPSGMSEKQILTAEAFLKSINTRVSDAFVRSLMPDYMLGIHVFNQNQPFIIFKSQSYQHSFAGMLEWERSIYNDLSSFMGRAGSSSLEIQKDPFSGENVPLKTAFEDKVVQNIDTRVLLNEAGGIEFLYAFPSQQTLVITTNEHTLIEVITRMRAVRVF